MTIYTIKVNKFETKRTTEIHEARAIAKDALIKKLKDRCDGSNYLMCTHEKMYVYRGETQIRLFATMGKHSGGKKTYSITIYCIPIPNGGYDFDLHQEIANGWKDIKGAN